jgi:hypothetical protein
VSPLGSALAKAKSPMIVGLAKVTTQTLIYLFEFSSYFKSFLLLLNRNLKETLTFLSGRWSQGPWGSSLHFYRTKKNQI